MFEDSGAVAADKVGAAPLLEELEHDAEGEAVEELVLAHGEKVTLAGGGGGGFFQCVFNAGELDANLRAIWALAAEEGEVGAGALELIFACEPARGLREEVDGRQEDGGDDDGDDEGHAPGERGAFDLEEGEVDPGLQDVADADEEAVNDDVAAAILCLRAFGLPDRDRGTESADAET